MEFILISSPNIAERAATIRNQLTSAPLIAAVDGPLGFFELGGGLLIAANGHQTNETTTLCYDGFSINKRAAFSPGCAAGLPIDIANAYLDACLDPINSNDLRGVFALMRFNPHTKAFTVAPDPLAHYPIFICGLGETLMVSNNCYLIQHALAAIGHKLSRSSKLAATYSAFGVGPARRTGFREIAVLPAGQVVTGIGPNWRLVSAAKQPKLVNRSYSELLDLAADRLCESVSAVAKTARDQTLQLSLDDEPGSRLLLAAAKAVGVKGLEIQAPENHPKGTDAANFIDAARRYVFRAQGIPSIPGIPAQTQESGRTRGLFQILNPSSYPSKQWNSSNKPKGIFWSNPLTAMQKTSSNDPIYGPCLSAYLHAGSDGHRKIAAKWAYQICGQMGPLQSLYQKSFLRAATHRLIEELSEYIAENPAATPTAIANSLRRRDIGIFMQQENMSHGAFDPLLDPAIQSIFRSLPDIQKTEVDFISDLTEKLEGMSTEAQPAKVKLNDRRSNAVCNIEIEHAQQVLPDLISLANALPSNHEIWQYFHRKKLLAALKNNRFFLKSPRRATHILAILHTFIWAAAAEDKTGVETLL